MKIKSIIYMHPVAKGRPRLGQHRTYTPVDTVRAENYIKYTLAQEFHEPPFGKDDALKLTVTFYRQRPASTPKRVTQPITRPDIDNYLKLLCDACNGVLWHDDSQITTMHIFKRYGTPCIELTVEEDYDGNA
ncbi:MAG: RusA family crossover junction endodeoxyribonuclease [Dehalococcoides mccartyi]|uniref:RusA family crossover junction endodeoxyribonuclease n=1 Tax=Dehalococcoides mccartyi TaxID=61435 RepID=UPI0030F938DA